MTAGSTSDHLPKTLLLLICSRYAECEASHRSSMSLHRSGQSLWLPKSLVAPSSTEPVHPGTPREPRRSRRGRCLTNYCACHNARVDRPPPDPYCLNSQHTLIMATVSSNVSQCFSDDAQAHLDYIGCRVRAAIRMIPDEESAVRRWRQFLGCELVSPDPCDDDVC